MDPTKSHPKFSRDAQDVGIKRCMAFLGISIFWAMADIWKLLDILGVSFVVQTSGHQAMAEHASYSIRPSARVSRAKKRDCRHHDIIMEPNDHPLNSKCLVGSVFFKTCSDNYDLYTQTRLFYQTAMKHFWVG